MEADGTWQVPLWTEYRTILADAPWNERGGGKIKRGADRHYPLMKKAEIIRTMMEAPCWRPCGSCHLYLWVTNNHLRDGLCVMAALKFRYITNVVWVKDRIGLGQYFRGRHELLLFGVKGRAMMPDTADMWPSVIEEARREHSRKPEQAYRLIEATSPGPRLEMFARHQRDGWDSWGNEI